MWSQKGHSRINPCMTGVTLLQSALCQRRCVPCTTDSGRVSPRNLSTPPSLRKLHQGRCRQRAGQWVNTACPGTHTAPRCDTPGQGGGIHRHLLPASLLPAPPLTGAFYFSASSNFRPGLWVGVMNAAQLRTWRAFLASITAFHAGISLLVFTRLSALAAAVPSQAPLSAHAHLNPTARPHLQPHPYPHPHPRRGSGQTAGGLCHLVAVSGEKKKKNPKKPGLALQIKISSLVNINLLNSDFSFKRQKIKMYTSVSKKFGN